MKALLFAIAVALLFVSGCVSWAARVEEDHYAGQVSNYTGNSRDTHYASSQPVKQTIPDGKVFVLELRGKKYEAIRKTDGKVYIIGEAHE